MNREIGSSIYDIDVYLPILNVLCKENCNIKKHVYKNKLTTHKNEISMVH